EWGVGAHAARVGALVAVEDALEVLGRLQGVDRRAVGDPEQADLGAVEKLLDHHAPAAGRMVDSSAAVVGDDDALARGQAVVLHAVRRPELVQRSRNLVLVRADPGSRGRDSRRLHDVLGERLGALQLRRLRGWAEAGDALTAYGVSNAGDQRC